MFRRLITFVFAAFIAAAAQAALDVNQANRAELESIKGIGPGLSGRILQARASGPFKDWPDMIERVPGVGTGNAARYSQAGLTVAGTAFDRAAMAQPAKSTKAAETAKAAKAETSGPRQPRMSDGEVRPSRKPRGEAREMR